MSEIVPQEIQPLTTLIISITVVVISLSSLALRTRKEEKGFWFLVFSFILGFLAFLIATFSSGMFGFVVGYLKGFSSKVSTSVTPISSMVSTIIVMWCGLFILSSASMCISLKEIEKHYAEKKKWKVFLYLFYGVIVGFAVASLFVILSHI